MDLYHLYHAAVYRTGCEGDTRSASCPLSIVPDWILILNVRRSLENQTVAGAILNDLVLSGRVPCFGHELSLKIKDTTNPENLHESMLA